MIAQTCKQPRCPLIIGEQVKNQCISLQGNTVQLQQEGRDHSTEGQGRILDVFC